MKINLDSDDDINDYDEIENEKNDEIYLTTNSNLVSSNIINGDVIDEEESGDNLTEPKKNEQIIWSRSFHLHTKITDSKNLVPRITYKKSCLKTIGNNYMEFTNPHLKIIGTMIDYIMYKNHLQIILRVHSLCNSRVYLDIIKREQIMMFDSILTNADADNFISNYYSYRMNFFRSYDNVNTKKRRSISLNDMNNQKLALNNINYDKKLEKQNIYRKVNSKINNLAQENVFNRTKFYGNIKSWVSEFPFKSETSSNLKKILLSSKSKETQDKSQSSKVDIKKCKPALSLGLIGDSSEDNNPDLEGTNSVVSDNNDNNNLLGNLIDNDWCYSIQQLPKQNLFIP